MDTYDLQDHKKMHIKAKINKLLSLEYGINMMREKERCINIFKRPTWPLRLNEKLYLKCIVFESNKPEDSKYT